MQAGLEILDKRDAIDVLTAFISDGGYNPGDRLPSERELISSLGMSRNTLRKALDVLEHDGAIWRHVGKGTFVSAHGGKYGTGDLSELSRKVSPIKLMRARLALEPAIVREAAIHASYAAVTNLNIVRDRCVEARNWDDYEAQDDMFHRTIAESADNVLLLSLFDQMNQVRRAVAWNTVVRKSDRPKRDHSSFIEHNLIVEAIENRDPDAAYAAMRTHLGSVSKRLFGEF